MGDVQQARVDLGARLRELRRSANLTGRELARAAGWDPSRVSRYETGRQMPSEADIRLWCTLTNAVLQIQDLIASLRNVSAAQLEWRRITSRRLQHRTGRIEAAAQVIRGYDQSLIPGLLQTRQYATEVLATCLDFVGTGEDLDAAVEERMSRQRAVVRHKNHHCHFIIAEQALHTTVGDDATMSDQLHALLDYTHTPQIDLGIVPGSAQFTVPTSSFVMYDANEVLVETMSSSLAITRPSEIGLYDKGFQRLTGQSQSGDRARDMIREALYLRGRLSR